MVLESIVNPISAEKKPWEMFFIGLVYSSVAIVLSLYIFREYASLVMIFLTVLASVPLMYSTIKMEEKKDLIIENESALLREHGKALSLFMFLFIGFVVSFMLWHTFLPDNLKADLFKIQESEIIKVESVGMGPTGNAVNIMSTLGNIFLNNIWVLLFSLLFAFFYGAGSIFILTWNASIIGAAIGIFVRGSSFGYLSSIPLGLLRYFIHGAPEMLAYFIAGLAGGIISIAIIRHDFATDKYKHILVDSIDLILLSVVVLFVAAMLEVFVTPLLF